MANSDIGSVAHRFLPALDWIEGYRRDWLLADVLAGLATPSGIRTLLSGAVIKSKHIVQRGIWLAFGQSAPLIRISCPGMTIASQLSPNHPRLRVAKIRQLSSLLTLSTGLNTELSTGFQTRMETSRAPTSMRVRKSPGYFSPMSILSCIYRPQPIALNC
jgi:hypothetical protein